MNAKGHFRTSKWRSGVDRTKAIIAIYEKGIFGRDRAII